MITRTRALIILGTPALVLVTVVPLLYWYARTPPNEFVAWARQNRVALRTPVPDDDFSDMEPLKKAVGDARVVALGEDSHGAREFFQLKHRMLEFLVKEMGFTAFAIEASLVDAFKLDEYVLNGTGRPEELLAGLGFWTWDTEEVLALVKWMRHHNEAAAHGRKIRFYGIDMQNPVPAIRMALAFLERVDRPFALKLTPVLMPETPDTLEGRRALAKKYVAMSLEDYKSLNRTIDDMISGFRANRESYVKSSSATEWDAAFRAAKVASQYVEFRAAALGHVWGIKLNRRDKAMAENLLWCLDREGPEGRVVLWAHNGHISRVSSYPGILRFMGAHLDGALGKKMLVVGLVFNKGTFQAMNFVRAEGEGDKKTRPTLEAFTVGPAEQGTLEGTLARVGSPLYFLDLRNAPAWGPVHRWLWWPHRASSLSAAFWGTRDYSFLCTKMAYDALLYVEEISRARPNPAIKISDKQSNNHQDTRAQRPKT